MRWRRSVSTSVLEFLWCVLWALTTQCPSGSRKWVSSESCRMGPPGSSEA